MGLNSCPDTCWPSASYVYTDTLNANVIKNVGTVNKEDLVSGSYQCIIRTLKPLKHLSGHPDILVRIF